MNIDPIRPYLDAVKWAVGLGILIGVFVTGCNHGKTSGKGERDKLATSLSLSQGSYDACNNALTEANKQYAANKQAATEQAARADAAEKGAQKDGQDYTKALGRIDADLLKAKREPSCRAQLEESLCVELH